MKNTFFNRMMFAFLMSAVTVSIAVFLSIWFNYGFFDGFYYSWLRTSRVAFVVVFLSVLFVAPRIQKFVNRFIK